ncbi:MAG: zinc-binding dehydrogenase [Pseudolabrys sp.]
MAGFAVQLAKHLGATVIATASAGNHAYVRSLGADKVIDYNKEDFSAIGPVCDVVFDTVGGGVRAGCYKRSSPAAGWFGFRPAPEGYEVPRADVKTLKPDVKRDRAHLERLVALLAAGAVKPPAIAHYNLTEAAQAHRVSEARHLQGKLVFDVR